MHGHRSMSRLKLTNVSKAFGATLALRRGDMTLEPGEVHALIGSNGSGKSTLCKVVAGSLRPDGGEVLIEDAPVTVSGPHAAQELGIGIFYQELSLAHNRTVAENICLASLPRKTGLFIDRAALMKRALRYIEMFATVAGEGFAADVVIDDLRADQRQLVEIMKTLASEGSILIFDEPTSALDRAQVERFFEVLRDLKREGRSIVFISHRMDEIFEIGDRVTVIRDGETVATTDITAVDPARLVTLMVGEQAQAEFGDAPMESARRADGQPALAVRGISGKGFAKVDFELMPGEILGFGGLHGHGQSAVLRALFGIAPRPSGEIALDGAPLSVSGPRGAIARGCAYVSGDRATDGIIQGRSIIENVVPVHALRARLRLARPASLTRAAMPAFDALKTKFASVADSINSLSGGNQQKVVIARWLIDRPRVMLLDDPTKGIDLSAKADLFALIRELAADGMAIILYSSEDAELLANADRILVFNNGAISRELRGGQRTRFNLYQAAYEAAE